MKRMILMEIHKLLRYRTFWIFMISYALLFFLVSLVFFTVLERFQATSRAFSGPQIFAFPFIWQTFTWLGGFFFLLLGLLVILLITNEFEFNTLRQHIIDGFSREQYLLGKYLQIGVFLLYACLVVFCVTAFWGTAGEGGQIISEYTFIFLGTFFLQGCGFLCFALMLSFYIKRAMLATFTFICFPIIIEPIIGWILNARFMEGISEKLPFSVLFSYIPTPQFLVVESLLLPSSTIIITGVIYTGLMIGLTWLKFKFSDL